MSRGGFVSPDMVKALLQYASLFPVGSLVQMNGGRIAKVIHANPNSFAKPVVTVLTDSEGNLLAEGARYQEDLLKDKDARIEKALPSDDLKSIGIMDGF